MFKKCLEWSQYIYVIFKYNYSIFAQWSPKELLQQTLIEYLLKDLYKKAI